MTSDARRALALACELQILKIDRTAEATLRDQQSVLCETERTSGAPSQLSRR